ncbi:MAG: putative cystathionine beta-lyases/cystathionine gamma-synthases protein [Microgenomates group bacterium GW2011_GWA2_47_8]|nr:MAG: putative cystathionine beta-lyases/cystathionine gamma-synthases protein [Microgenomates group bacterium GW2011_GWA2_47_8]
MNTLGEDIRQTLDELKYLLGDADRRLQTFLCDIAKNKRHIHTHSYAESRAMALGYRQEIALLTKRLSSRDESVTRDTQEYLRTHQTLFGALITMTDWQSPSYTHTLASQAGRETGRIYATMNDYKRDQHWDAYRYEQAFLKENIDVLIKFPVHVHATSSGMAAFTTILLFLLGEKKATGKVLCGTSVYFENKALITQLFADQLIIVDESDTKKIIKSIDTYHPSVIFLDSLTNTPDVVVPDLSRVIRHLLSAKKETHLVIDNTGLSIRFQPFPILFGRRTNLRLIQFESLNKYHQFGMDRVTGGIIAALGGDTGKLFDYRAHAGTNITDVGAASLPTPNRSILAKRLTRHSRNAAFLARALKTWIHEHPNSPFTGISFPGVGSYFTIKFKKRYNTIPSYRRFVKLSLAAAKRYNINVVSGTSFGLNTTRIYLTALRSKPNTPFVRIAVGTEHIHALQSLRDALIETLKRFR